MYSGKVYSMMAPYFDLVDGVTVYIDNLYTTHALHLALKAKNVTVIGTVRYQNLPRVLKPLFKQFKRMKREPATTTCNNMPFIELVRQVFVIEGKFNLFRNFIHVCEGQWRLCNVLQ